MEIINLSPFYQMKFKDIWPEHIFAFIAAVIVVLVVVSLLK